jgi:hypothetical protein
MAFCVIGALCQKPSVGLTSIELIFATKLSLLLPAKRGANDPARVKTILNADLRPLQSHS